MLNKPLLPGPPTDDVRSGVPRASDVVLAITSLSAAAIHFAVTGDHFDEHVVFGLFFLAVAWAQILWAVGILLAPSRRFLMAGLIGNAVVVALWGLSRTVGVPIGPEPWTPEAVGGADLVCTVLEFVIVGGCAARLTSGAESEVDRTRPASSLPTIAFGLSIVLVTSVAIASGGRGHGHGAVTAATHEHTAVAAAGTGTTHDGHHSVGGSGEPDLSQIAIIREAMSKYRDEHVALAEGWRKEHPDWPELGAHFVRDEDWTGSGPARPDLDLVDPEFLMYSKLLTGRWKLVAVAYVVDQAIYPDPPTDLTGAIYHEHVWNCIDDGEELEEEDWGVLSREECDIMGGVWSPGGVWMTHVWLIDNPNGIFAETDPLLTTLKV